MKYIIAFILALCTGNAFATDYLIASAEEANRLGKEAKAGDRIILRDGVYKDAVIKFHNAKGTAQLPVTFMAEHDGKVFFEGNSRLSFSGSYLVINGFVWQNGGKELEKKSVIEFRTGSEKQAAYCVLKNCAVIGYNTLDLNTDNKWISVYGEHNTVSHCLLKDKFNRGATLTVWLNNGQPAHHTITYNYFLNRQNGPEADNGLESLRIGDSKTSSTNAHCVVAFNRFEDCDGELEIISNKSYHNSYFNNTFYNSNGGLTLRHGGYCLVAGNYFDGGTKDKSYGLRIVGENHVAVNNYFTNLKGSLTESFRAPLTIVNGIENSPPNGYLPVKRVDIEANIFYNCTAPLIRIGAYSSKSLSVRPDTVNIIHNIFKDDKGNTGAILDHTTPAANLCTKGNLIIASGLQERRKGFDKVKKGTAAKYKTPEMEALLVKYSFAGADVVDASIKAEVIRELNVPVTAKQVGPRWMQ